MQLRFGNYFFAVNENTVSIARQMLFNEGVQAYGYRETWTINGFLQGVSQADLTAKIALLQAACLQQGVAVGLFDNNGAPTAHGILASQAVGGVRCIRGPEFAQGGGAEYSTYRSYSLTLEAEVRAPTVRFLAWTEMLSFSGGGPKRLFLQTLIGPPQEQIVAAATPFRVTQQGAAIGQFAWPLPPLPIWPRDEHRPLRKIDFKSPKRFGGAYVDYETTWSYQFESANPFVGEPNRWPLP